MRLSKWQALGNDYLLVEQAELPQPLSPERVRELCDYHYGVGSDGLLEVLATDGTNADVRIWNPEAPWPSSRETVFASRPRGSRGDLVAER